ncbi:hypothetical protein [Streptomyces sp. NPDC057686]|uniref:Vgb family protein n=1 Tax=Streptomyces sp. NPDC057686 TaxID=3346212 RepID=UPI00369CFEB6
MEISGGSGLTKAVIGLGNASTGGVALDEAGYAYVTNFHSGAIHKVHLASGEIIESTIVGQVNSVALDRRGSAFVTDLYNGMVYRVRLSTGQITVGAGYIEYPVDIGVDVTGRIVYVISALGRVYRVNMVSGIRTEVVSGLPDLLGLALDGQGNAYVTSIEGQLLRVGLATGEVTKIAAGLGDAYGVAVDGQGNAYTSAFTEGLLIRVDLTNGNLTEAASGLGNPFALAIDRTGSTYVANTHGVLWKIKNADTVALGCRSCTRAGTQINNQMSWSHRLTPGP